MVGEALGFLKFCNDRCLKLLVGSIGRQSGKRNACSIPPRYGQSGNTSTKLALRRQTRLSFKKQKVDSGTVKHSEIDPARLMYRSNISGVIKTMLELELGDRHIRQLEKTPFWPMVDAIRVHRLDPIAYMKCDATVCWIIQTYHLGDEKFYIGGVGLPLRNNDIRLMFGIEGGKDNLDLAQSVKSPSDFMQRRCPNMGRMSSKVIKDLLMQAICGRTESDKEDVAKLLCLYICAKLFFATTGEHIGWAFVRIIDKLKTLRMYDWTATIRNTLISSLNETHRELERVTGCVVALLVRILYILLHRILLHIRRWNLRTLIGRLKGVNLLAIGFIKVKCGKIVGTSNECNLLKPALNGMEADQNEGIVFDVDPVTVWHKEGADVGVEDMAVVQPSFDWWRPDSLNGGNVEMSGLSKTENKNIRTPDGKKKMNRNIFAAGESWPVLFPDLLDLSCTADIDTVHTDTSGQKDELKKARERINDLEKEVKTKMARVCELEFRVESIEKLLRKQAANLFIGFDSVIIENDAEIARLKNLVQQLKGTISNLQDNLDDHEVHDVRQFMANDGSNHRTPSNSRSGGKNVTGADTSGKIAHQPSFPAG
ncbi:hypothetical protein ACSBR2_038157 [Camellia fascicularis]